MTPVKPSMLIPGEKYTVVLGDHIYPSCLYKGVKMGGSTDDRFYHMPSWAHIFEGLKQPLNIYCWQQAKMGDRWHFVPLSGDELLLSAQCTTDGKKVLAFDSSRLAPGKTPPENEAKIYKDE